MSNLVELRNWDLSKNPYVAFLDFLRKCEDKWPLLTTEVSQNRNNLFCLWETVYLKQFMQNENISYAKKLLILSYHIDQAPLDYTLLLSWMLCYSVSWLDQDVIRSEYSAFYLQYLSIQTVDTHSRRFATLKALWIEWWFVSVSHAFPLSEKIPTMIAIHSSLAHFIGTENVTEWIELWKTYEHEFTLLRTLWLRTVLAGVFYRLRHQWKLRGVTLPESLNQAISTLDTSMRGRIIAKGATPPTIWHAPIAREKKAA